MKCPLFTAAEMSHEPELKPSSNDCLKEECAWWDETRACCEYRSMRIELSRLVDRLDEISKKMPHEMQFRK